MPLLENPLDIEAVGQHVLGHHAARHGRLVWRDVVGAAEHYGKQGGNIEEPVEPGLGVGFPWYGCPFGFGKKRVFPEY